MRMPYRVFLSSTFSDLATYRATVQGAIRQLGAIDVSMEHFGARDERPVDECIRLVSDQSDLFVGVYAHRYGFVPDGAKISISEIEYQTASNVPLPRFIYIVDDDAPWLPAHMDDGANRKRLIAFKAALRKRHVCQTFRNQDHLATSVVADIGRHIAMHATTPVAPDPTLTGAGFEALVPEAHTQSVDPVPAEWTTRRRSIKSHNRNMFLTHVIKPSTTPGQKFDVFIYLIRHRSEDFSDVQVAEFFLGKYWGNKIFPAVPKHGFVGISTSAYGSFLCICRVTFVNGGHVNLERYIDFEMQRTAGL